MTKIEIGVVCAIIVILAALLYPALEMTMNLPTLRRDAYNAGYAAGKDEMPPALAPESFEEDWKKGWIDGNQGKQKLFRP